jgi:hypothetical protein
MAGNGGQGGGQQAGGASTQGAQQVGGDVRQMTVGDLLDLANQQNIDIAPVTELLNGMNLSPEVGVSGTGNVTAGGEDDAEA